MDKPPKYRSMESRGWVHHSGYRWLSIPSIGKVLEHRHLMEVHLGRKLLPTELVHHRNGNKTDNRTENLELVERSKHTAQHRAHRMTCLVCGDDDAHGSHGLCGFHAGRVHQFIATYNLATPANKEALNRFFMGIALAFSSEEVDARISELL